MSTELIIGIIVVAAVVAFLVLRKKKKPINEASKIQLYINNKIETMLTLSVGQISNGRIVGTDKNGKPAKITDVQISASGTFVSILKTGADTFSVRGVNEGISTLTYSAKNGKGASIEGTATVTVVANEAIKLSVEFEEPHD